MSYLQRLQQIRDLRFEGGAAQRQREKNLFDLAHQQSTRNLCDRIEEGASLKDIQALLFEVPLEPQAVVMDLVDEVEIFSKPGHDEFPLLVAIGCQRTDVVALLLEHGADPNVYGSPFNPLMSALAKKSLECVPLLLRAGADPVLVWKTPTTPGANDKIELVAGCVEHCSHQEALDTIGVILNSGYDINNIDLDALVSRSRNFPIITSIIDLARQHSYDFERFTHLPILIEKFFQKTEFEHLFQKLLDWGAVLDPPAVRNALHNAGWGPYEQKKETLMEMLDHLLARTLWDVLNSGPTVLEVLDQKPRKL